MNKESDIVRELASDSREAYKVLFMEYFPKVRYFIVHLLKSEIMAEDMAQDIFITIWTKHAALSGIQSFNAYIYRMAKNSVLNSMQHNVVKDRYAEHVGQQAQSAYSIEEEFHAKEIELLVDLTVSNMPNKRRQVYQLSRTEGLKNEEIAEKLNLSKKTVENHLNIALKEIRKTIRLFTSFFI